MAQHTRGSIIAAAAAAVVASLVPVGGARATDYVWNGSTGAQNWQDMLNWTPAGFPNANTDTANLSVALAGNLTLDVGATSVTTGALTLGGTTGVVTTDVISTGGALIFDNLATNATITSAGVAGSVNVISAPMLLGDNLDITAASTNGLTLAGNMQMNGANRNILNGAAGSILKLGSGPSTEIRLDDFTDPLTGRTLTLNGVANSVTEINGTFSRGPNNVGAFAYDTGGGLAGATFIYNTPQTVNTALQRATYVVNDNLAFGAGTLTAAGAGTLTNTLNFTHTNGNNATWSGTVTSTKPGGVTIPNVILMGNSMAFAGGENIVLSGALTQGNNRAMGNAIASGKSLTLTPDPVSNTTGISIGISRVLGDGNRTWIVEGTGTTIINGLVVNNLTDDTLTASPVINGNFEKRGSGRTELNNGGNTIRGEVRARGGNLVFGAANSWGTPTGINVQVNGGIWYTPGVGAAGWDDGPNSLVAKILPASTGFFAVPASAAGTNFDFSTGNLNTNAKNVGIGADGNVTFTGTVTPDAVVGYNWGGNTGTLTLGANASVGAHAVSYKNGGTVVLTGTQSYTGITTLQGANMVTSQAGILTKNLNSTGAPNVFTPTILSVGQLADGGANSTLGASSNDAANLVFNGGTLRYTGAAGGTDRLFSVGTAGGTIDSAGTGALQLTNTGSNVTTGTGARTLTLTGANNGSIAGVLANGTLVTDTLAVTKAGAGTWSLAGANTYTGATAVNAGRLSFGQSVTSTSGVTIAAGAAAEMADVAGDTVMDVPLTIAGASNAWTGQLDLQDNDLIVRYAAGQAQATLAQVTNQIKSGLNISGTLWTGNGITSTAAANGGFLTALGVLTNDLAELGFGGTGPLYTTFAGRTIDENAILVKYTYFGDADLSGIVDSSDYFLIDNGFGAQLTGWVNGDFDYSGVIDSTDYFLIDNAFGSQGGPLSTELLALREAQFGADYVTALQASVAANLAAVPEPGTIGLLGVAALGLLARRRRTCQN